MNSKIASLVEDNQDIQIMPGQLQNFRRIVNKCISEYMSKDSDASNWISEVMHVNNKSNATMPGSSINGFIQRFEVTS